MMIIFWIGLIVVLLLVEIATVGLTTIWFAAGALVALIACALGLGVIGQVILFLAVSFILLYFTRPWAMKYLTPHKVATNYENAIGKEVRVTEEIDNRKSTGVAILNGQEWTARSDDENVIIGNESMAVVTAVEGVKLIVRPVE